MGMTRVEYRPPGVKLVALSSWQSLLADPSRDPLIVQMYISDYSKKEEVFSRIQRLLASKCGMYLKEDAFSLWIGGA